MRTIGGRYELRGELASGGMATVHLARQLGAAGFARIVAVKRLHERFARDPEFVAMFLDEARLVGRMRHPNVVQTLDVVQEKDEHGGSELFIVMEYVHGDALVRLLGATKRAMAAVPLRIASAIMVGVLHGLHEAHEAKSEIGEPLGIVHRDVSPHNVLVGIDGVARVLDFGVAKAEERMSATSSGTIKGKLAYMAPEQVESGALVDRRTDVYAAAIVLWELLTTQKLFQGVNDAATVKAVLEANIAAPSTHRSEVPPALDAVVLRGLARLPADRYATAADFANAIAEVVPPAAPNELGAWVRKTAQEDLDLKTKLIAAIEARGIAKSKSEAAKSLEAVGRASSPTDVTKTQLVADAPTSPTRAALERPATAPARAPSVQKTMPMPPGFVAPVIPVMRAAATPPPSSKSGLVITAAGGAVALLAIGAGVAVYVAAPPRKVATSPSASTSAAPIAAPIESCPNGMAKATGGRFFVGFDDGESQEVPAHKVFVSAFCIDRYEVTAQDYKACADRGDCIRAARETIRAGGPERKPKQKWDAACNENDPAARGRHPANCIDWVQASNFCERRGARLPTNAEWEYAARGPDQRLHPWGDRPPGPSLLNACGPECTAWLKGPGTPDLPPLYSPADGWETTAPIGSFAAGASHVGAEDMMGNVWEWVSDWFAPYDKDVASEQKDPTGPKTGSRRTIRGGGWDLSVPSTSRVTFRGSMDGSARDPTVGFRCAKGL